MALATDCGSNTDASALCDCLSQCEVDVDAYDFPSGTYTCEENDADGDRFVSADGTSKLTFIEGHDTSFIDYWMLTPSWLSDPVWDAGTGMWADSTAYGMMCIPSWGASPLSPATDENCAAGYWDSGPNPEDATVISISCSCECGRRRRGLLFGYFPGEPPCCSN